MREDLPTGTVTFLFTDIEGSTRMIEDLGEEGYVEALAEHRRLLRRAFSTRGGVEVDTQGDAFLYAFGDAADAVVAAAHAQQALEGGQIRVRMGLHTAAPLLTDEGYAGRELHRAARIGASGHGGQVVVSAATRALVDGELTELGEHRLKDFEEPVALFQLGSGRFPPLKTISNTNLPHPASSFVGRTRERAELLRLLQNGSRLVTLSGPGGSGKTRLALEVGSELVPAFKAGVFWVGLQTLSEPALVTETVGQTLGARGGLAEHIGDRELLLLLDNFEQVVEAAAELGELLELCPRLRLLITSRALLRITGEVVFEVPPLEGSDAVELFCVRSRLESDETISELCRRLDDLPLAVELAAARTRVLSPAQMLDRLGQRLDLFKGGRDADPRQRTLRATIEWSHDLLTAEEQQLFARLAVFTGGSTLDAAEEICGAELDVLQSLVDRSLLRHTGDRFWMLDTIHEFAVERFHRSPEVDALSSGHAAWYAGLADRAEEQMRGPDETDWLARLEAELGNLRAALAWLETTSAATSCQKLAAALWHVWGERGHLREGTRWLQRAIELRDGDPVIRVRALNVLCSLLGDQDRISELKPLALESDRLSTQLGDTAGSARARTLLAWAAQADGDFRQARSLYDQAVALARADGDRWRLGVALNNLGDCLVDTRELDDAVAALTEALVITREVGFPDATARVLSNLGLALVGRGDVDDAAGRLTEALTLFAATGSIAAAAALNGLAAVASARGNPRRAARLLGTADRVHNENGFPRVGHEMRLYTETLTAAQATLGELAAAQLVAEGGKLSRDDAIAYALEADARGSVKPSR